MNKKLIVLALTGVLFNLNVYAAEKTLSIEEMSERQVKKDVAVKKVSEKPKSEIKNTVASPRIDDINDQIALNSSSNEKLTKDINPFSGERQAINQKTKELNQLILDEQIAQKKLSIKRFNDDLTSVGKKQATVKQPISTRVGSAEEDFDRAIKSNVFSKKAKVAQEKPSPAIPVTIQNQQKAVVASGVEQKSNLNAIIKNDKELYANFTDIHGISHTVKTGDSIGDEKVLVGNDMVVIGKTPYKLTAPIGVNTYKNPDHQLFGELVKNGGGTGLPQSSLTPVPFNADGV